MKRILMLLALLGVFLQSCKKSDTGQQGKELVLSGAEQAVVSRSNDFAFQLYKESFTHLKQGENALLSPLSIQAALAMTLQGAKGETESAIAKAIGLDGLDRAVLNGYFKKLIDDLPQLDPLTKLRIANSIWYRQEFEVIPAFLDVNRQFYRAEVHPLDFASPLSVERINDWVKTHTENKIEKIVDQLEANLVMLLVNAVYFKGSWEQQFDPALTRQDVFYPGTDAAQVLHADYMQVEQTFAYTQHADFEAVELPYGQKKYSMVLIRPKEGISVADMVGKFSVAGAWDNLLGETSAHTQTVNMRLYLPKFKFSYANKLNDELQAMGMGIAFTEEADFTGINPEGRLAISEVKHKSFIEVNEEGTEAAAVTSVGIMLTSVLPGQPMVFRLDKPFLFAIRERSSRLVLFVGQISDPGSSSTELQ